VFPFGFAGDEEAAPVEAVPAAPAEGAASPSVLAAPVSKLTQDQQELLNYATAAVKAGFLSSPLYAVVTYHPQSSLVQRAVNQEVLRKEQLLNVISTTTGATNMDRARLITEHLSMQTMLVGTVDVKSDVKANSTEVTLQAQLVHSVTGEVLRTAAAAGAAQGAEGVPMLMVEQRAALDAAQKILPAMGIELVRLPAPPAETAPAGKGKAVKGSKTKKVPAPVPSPANTPAPPAGGTPPAAPAIPSDRAPGTDERDAPAAAAPAVPAVSAKVNREAEKQAREAARLARRQAEVDRKAAEKAAEEARKAERAAAKTRTAKATNVMADQQPETAPEGQVAPAARSTAGVTVPSAQGTSSFETGLPVPYGYAVGESKEIVAPRTKNGLKVPAWLGVAGFLTGIMFLL
jgi:hypothetical protein